MCLLVCSPVLLSAQQSGWQDFDQLIENLEQELLQLRQQLSNIEALSIAQGNELDELRLKLTQREALLTELTSLYEESKTSVLSLELKVQKRTKWIVGLGAVVVVQAAALVAMAIVAF
jgi:chromosome segregation ATPase